eukprot:468890_1
MTAESESTPESVEVKRAQMENDADFARQLQRQELYQDFDVDNNPGQQRNTLQRNVLQGVEDTRTQSFRVLFLYTTYGIMELITTITMLSIYWNQPCSGYLKYFVLFFSTRFVFGIPMHIIRYRHPDDTQCLKRAMSFLDLLYLCWFIVGQVAVFSEFECSPPYGLWVYAMVLVCFTYFILFLPILLILMVCLCLPCVFILLRLLAENPGAAQDDIDKIPERRISADQTDNQCSVCMSNYVAGDTVRDLYCGHTFHKHCVDQWLPIKRTCPLCRRDITENDNEGLPQPQNELALDINSAV